MPSINSRLYWAGSITIPGAVTDYSLFQNATGGPIEIDPRLLPEERINSVSLVYDAQISVKLNDPTNDIIILRNPGSVPVQWQLPDLHSASTIFITDILITSNGPVNIDYFLTLSKDK